MQIDKKNLEQDQVELTVKVTKTEALPWMTRAAVRISEARNIKGFRPGKAPFEVVKREFGESAILSEALEDIVDGSLGEVLEKENIRPYGQVGFELLPTLDPNDAVAYKATIIPLPQVTLGDWTTPKLTPTEAIVSDAELNSALDELAKMSMTEKESQSPAAQNDQVILDFEVKVDDKVIEGGTATDFAVIIGDGRMIPGFEDKLVNSKPGDVLNFKLNFPQDYHADVAGKEADFAITVKKVMKREKPEMTDDFAKKVGAENLEDLKSRIKANLLLEKQQQENDRLEIAAIKQIVETSRITELPKQMVNDTVSELVHDFEHNLAHQGMSFEQYFKTTNKNMEDLRKDFEPKAVDRIKSSLVLEELAIQEKLTITTAEIEEELEAQRRHFAQRPEVLNDLKQPEYRRHVANTLLNRKLIRFIKDKIVEQKTA